ncbi:uncharacterized protein PHACADRAFT_261720 [Phanerochaete carnosa HHB-10118-sp]|uniref:Uncharacterized protein n=1 Tax=Phanerochaete carnosa (strain HHB-10118-sp) TaxID=650164 RepID=K5UP31_PHACS|nr:uncharacterized protein PHACADRAFT_261720 [Phanerochaete carnosa HHB-10118-sp]EKM51521.1 hypothetical protein PHACADRAFT_261720 [Phanerochaete carnosa HHB-10118-sp]
MAIALMHTETPPLGRHLYSVPEPSSSSGSSHRRGTQPTIGGDMTEKGKGGSREPVDFPHTSNDDVLQPLSVRILRKSHTRSHSTSSFTSRPTVAAPTHRERFVSISERSSSSKSTSLHQFLTAPRGLMPKPVPVHPVETVDAEETIGAFSLTSCPRRHLHHLLSTAPRSWNLKHKPERLRVDFDFAPDTSQTQHESSDGSPPLSPIPSICRTPSSYSSESEYFPSPPSSAGPATPVHSATVSPVLPQSHLRPILEALEDASKFCVRTACASCGTVGSNYPCCPRCNEMWCSRECRLKSTGGKRHICKKT